jgi:monofunctional glycosyltransferase
MSEFRASDGDAPGNDTPSGRVGVRTATAVASAPTHVSRTASPQPDIAADIVADIVASAAPPTAPPASTPPTSKPAKPRSRLRTAFRWMFRTALAVTAVFAVLILAYRFINPPLSALMLIQTAGGVPITRTWVPLERISPNLVRAVIMSEDAGFCRHYGVDLKELEAAFEQAIDGNVRGGSTISMQTAKNLFLWPSKSYVRKAIEIPLTLAMEAVWPKARMLEIYLNIAEWGPGIFGAEAAARHHFNKSASRLTEQEAALLAVTLPAPLIREPGNPSALLERMGNTILGRMRSATRHTACIPQSKT